MTSRLELPAAGLPHAPVIAALHAACFDDEPWSEQDVAELLAMPGAIAVLALDGGAPLGFALARAAAEDCELLSIGVISAARRGGVGRRLLHAVFNRAANAGAARLFLEVAADNRAARALYRREGFTRIGSRKGYYRRPGGPAGDAVVLARRLGAFDPAENP